MKLKKILVPLRDNSNADAEAVRLACSLAREDNAEVHLIYVIEVERSRSLDNPLHSDMEKAEGILNDGEVIATSMGCKIVKDFCQARELGPAIVDEAGKGFDLIVMGVEYEKSLGVFDPGKTIRNIFRESQCHVLLYRSPIVEDVS
jgi:nucleotide-binding universal stress UspA family protein